MVNVKVCTRVCALSGLRALARDRLHPRVVPQTSVYAPCNDRRPIKRNESRWTVSSSEAATRPALSCRDSHLRMEIYFYGSI